MFQGSTEKELRTLYVNNTLSIIHQGLAEGQIPPKYKPFWSIRHNRFDTPAEVLEENLQAIRLLNFRKTVRSQRSMVKGLTATEKQANMTYHEAGKLLNIGEVQCTHQTTG